MKPRRAQTPIAIRSDRAAQRLALLTSNGRSQVQVIEEALDRMPLEAEDGERAARLARIHETLRQLAARGGPSMAEFDAREYDERGNPR